MSKAEKGDLIRITNSDDAPKGAIYEVIMVDNDGDAYVDGTFDDGSELFFTDYEYVIHRKADEESACSNCGKQGVHTCRGAEYYAEQAEQDVVNSPQHYTQGKFETIEVIEEITKGYDDGFIAYCIGNTLKYIARAPFKHGTPAEDLLKAERYIRFAIEHLNAKSTQD